MSKAACKGHADLFFAPLAERPPARLRRENAAREVCASCPVFERCRSFARLHREYGFWAGESEDDRAEAGFSISLRMSRHADPMRAG